MPAITPNVIKPNIPSSFGQYIYEYQKGVRDLILTTENDVYQKGIEEKLSKEKIDYAIQKMNNKQINVFFGAKDCVDVVKTFIHKKLNELSPEQDFILGIMLGYDRLKQCSRYLNFMNKTKK